MSRFTRSASRAVFTLLAVALLASTVGAGASGATGVPRAAIPTTPTLIMPLYQGVNDKPGLTTAQKGHLSSDIRWLHNRLNVALPRIQYTGAAQRTDGLFDKPTTDGVIFFKTWANKSRALLHLSPLFAKIDGNVGQSTVAVIAIVAAYFQQHPLPHYADPATVSQLTGYLLGANELLSLSKTGYTNPPNATWQLTDSVTSDDGPARHIACAPSSPLPVTYSSNYYEYLDGNLRYGSTDTAAYHFQTTKEVADYVATHSGKNFLNCVRTHVRDAIQADDTVTLYGSPTVNAITSVGSGVGYQLAADVDVDGDRCVHYVESYIVPVGLTVLLTDFTGCQVGWDADKERALLSNQANRLVIKGGPGLVRTARPAGGAPLAPSPAAATDRRLVASLTEG